MRISIGKKIEKCHVLCVMSCFQGACMALQRNGSFTSHTFADVITHLLKKKYPGPALLIMDGHNSHHDIDALDMYVNPPHSLKKKFHAMSPLHVMCHVSSGAWLTTFGCSTYRPTQHTCSKSLTLLCSDHSKNI